MEFADANSKMTMARTILAGHGRIDVLVNNPALFTTLGKQPFDQIPLDAREAALRVTVTGPLLAWRVVLPATGAAKMGPYRAHSSGTVARGVVNGPRRAAPIIMTSPTPRRIYVQPT